MEEPSLAAEQFASIRKESFKTVLVTEKKNSNPAATQKITMTQLKFCFAKKSGFNFDEARLKFCSKANLPGSNFRVKKSQVCLYRSLKMCLHTLDTPCEI